MLSATAAWGRAKGWSSQGAGRQPVASRSPRKETHLLRMSMLPLNPSKGFPGPLCVRRPSVFDVVILCVFTALKSLSLRSCHVMLLIQTLCLKSYREPLMPLSDASLRIRKEMAGDAVISLRGLYPVTPVSHPLNNCVSHFAICVWRGCSTVVWQ